MLARQCTACYDVLIGMRKKNQIREDIMNAIIRTVSEITYQKAVAIAETWKQSKASEDVKAVSVRGLTKTQSGYSENTNDFAIAYKRVCNGWKWFLMDGKLRSYKGEPTIFKGTTKTLSDARFEAAVIIKNRYAPEKKVAEAEDEPEIDII